MFNLISQEFKYKNNLIKIETGMIARQASSSIVISVNDTVILITIVEQKQKIISNQIFLPLTVNYYEKSYAYGKFPNNFLRREIRLTENEILISRLIDRSIRPLFNKNFFNEVQIAVTVLSADSRFNSDIISIIGVSAALIISNIPFEGIVSSSRVGYINNNFILNPNIEELKESKLDLIISRTENSIVMIESSSNFLPKNIIVDSIKFGFQEQDIVIENLKIFKEKFLSSKFIINENNIKNTYNKHSLYSTIYNIAYDKIKLAYLITNKFNRNAELEKIKTNIIDTINNTLLDNNDILINFNLIEKNIIRQKIIEDKIRIDGRSYDDIRDIDIKINLLPRVHGSSLFTRGETQSLVSVTLGNDRDGQTIDNIFNSYIDKFILHYNFNPYCVNEIGNIGFPKRREIGHGKLVKSSISFIIPEYSLFPYSIRIVSEITESNGSSSMASICGSSLALMDAGVPIKNPIAGIAMGLIKENDNIVILSDISGCEDHFGDMDLKVSGNNIGITSIQMDIKINSINIDIIDKMLDEACISINKIINIMNNSINSPKKFLSNYAPKIYTFKIQKDKIKNLIGKGGSVIKSLMKETESSIEIDDNGFIKIYTINEELGNKTINRIKELIYDFSLDSVYKGIITRILNFGIFVSLNDKKEGLIHISEIKKNNKDNLNKLKIGQQICVKIKEIDKFGRINLSLN